MKYFSFSFFLFLLFILPGCGIAKNSLETLQTSSTSNTSSATDFDIFGKWTLTMESKDGSSNLRLVECQLNTQTENPMDGILYEDEKEIGTCFIDASGGNFHLGSIFFVGDFVNFDEIDGTWQDQNTSQTGKGLAFRTKSGDFDVRGKWYQYWEFQEASGNSIVTFLGDGKKGDMFITGANGEEGSVSGTYIFENGILIYQAGEGQQSAKIEAHFFDANTLSGVWSNPVDGTNFYKARRLK
jgi:hypothetical protein